MVLSRDNRPWFYLASFLRHDDLLPKNWILFLPLSHSVPSHPVFPLEFLSKVNRKETRVMGLLCGESCMILTSTVFSLYFPLKWRTDRQMDRGTDDCIQRDMLPCAENCKHKIYLCIMLVKWFVLFWVQDCTHRWPAQLPPNLFASHLPPLSPRNMSRRRSRLHELSPHPPVPSAPPCRRQATILLSRRRLTSTVHNMVWQWQDLRVLRRQSLRGNECRPEELAQNITNKHRYMP